MANPNAPAKTDMRPNLAPPVTAADVAAILDTLPPAQPAGFVFPFKLAGFRLADKQATYDGKGKDKLDSETHVGYAVISIGESGVAFPCAIYKVTHNERMTDGKVRRTIGTLVKLPWNRSTGGNLFTSSDPSYNAAADSFRRETAAKFKAWVSTQGSGKLEVSAHSAELMDTDSEIVDIAPAK